MLESMNPLKNGMLEIGRGRASSDVTVTKIKIWIGKQINNPIENVIIILKNILEIVII